MKTSPLITSVLALCAVLAVQTVSAQQRQGQQQRAIATQRRVVAPPAAKTKQPAEIEKLAGKLKVTSAGKHGNLEVFLLEGDDRFDTKGVLTLDEAMEKKGAVKVKETQQVNELTVTNKDKAATVFIMAGDIVKGGQQDRTLATDLPLAVKSGEVPVEAFCVEQGRWAARRGESVAEFASSKNALPSKEAKLAVRAAKSQGAVWDSVAKSQTKLNSNLQTTVNAPDSPTSLQLALENDTVKTETKAIAQELREVVEKNPRAVGFVTAINGEINSAEIFAGHDLFRRVWPKLLDAAATEAIAEKDAKPAATPATPESVSAFLAQAEETKAVREKIHGSLANVSAESEQAALFQTVDGAKEDRWLRRSVIKK